MIYNCSKQKNANRNKIRERRWERPTAAAAALQEMKRIIVRDFFLNTLIVSGLAKRGDTPDAQSPCPL